MAGFIFDGEVNSLSPRQLEFVSDVLEKRGFRGNHVAIQTLGQAGDNYIANVKRIIVEENDGKTFRMVAKVAPTNEVARARTGIPILFANESLMYQEVLPKLVGQQIAAGVPDEQLYKYAECFGVLLEAPHELILLEDLQLSKYVMLDRFKPLTDKSVKLTLRNFAILHSLSMVLKKEDTETFETFNKKLIDFFGTLIQVEEFVQYTVGIEKDALDVLDDEEYKAPVRGSISKLNENLPITRMGQDNLKQSVVLQGDGWTNNIMFRLKDGEPLDSVMIDYQLSKVSNPTCDVLYMIFSCTDHVTRQSHYHEWIDYYHTELDKSLSNFGTNAETMYPKELLYADLKKFSKVFFATAIMLFSILIRKPEDAAKIKNAMEKEGDLENVAESLQTTKLDADSVALFKSKVMGLVDSYREFGYID